MTHQIHLTQIIKLSLISIVLFLNLNSCIKRESYTIQINTVESDRIDTIFFDTTKIVTGIDFYIKSDVSGVYQIDFHDGDSYKISRRFQNSIDTSFCADWYTSKVIIHYQPDSNMRGKFLDIMVRPHIL